MSATAGRRLLWRTTDELAIKHGRDPNERAESNAEELLRGRGKTSTSAREGRKVAASDGPAIVVSFGSLLAYHKVDCSARRLNCIPAEEARRPVVSRPLLVCWFVVVRCKREAFLSSLRRF